MERSHRELIRTLLQKFIQVTLDDGSVHAGYIGNPEDFKNDEMPEEMVLINGLMKDRVKVSQVIDVQFPKREDTTKIPIVGFEDDNTSK